MRSAERVETNRKRTDDDRRRNQFKHHAFTDNLSFGDLKPVKLESNQFNKQWTVMSADPKRAYQVMDPSTMEFLLSLEGKYHFELNKGLLVIYRMKSGFEQRLKLMKIAQDFSSAVPNDLIKPIPIVG